MNKIRVLAIVCIRNEEIHIRRCLTHLIESGLDVILIDNDSTDRSVEIAKEFLGNGLLRIERLPWSGEFSLADQLNLKKQIILSSKYDWIVHADADEWLCSSVEGQTLYEGIVEADAAGFNCINFYEIVFVPLTGEDFYVENYAELMSTYYFYNKFRLHRAWKRTTTNPNGDYMLGWDSYAHNLKISPNIFFLRHYIILSEQHAKQKYLKRVYSTKETKKGWHVDRTNIKHFNVKNIPGLKHTDNPNIHKFDLGTPLKRHFWEW